MAASIHEGEGIENNVPVFDVSSSTGQLRSTAPKACPPPPRRMTARPGRAALGAAYGHLDYSRPLPVCPLGGKCLGHAPARGGTQRLGGPVGRVGGPRPDPSPSWVFDLLGPCNMWRTMYAHGCMCVCVCGGNVNSGTDGISVDVCRRYFCFPKFVPPSPTTRMPPPIVGGGATLIPCQAARLLRNSQRRRTVWGKERLRPPNGRPPQGDLPFLRPLGG